MNTARRRSLLARVLFAAWGMLTLVLLFCVILLVFEMLRKGQDPLASLREPPSNELPQPVEVSEAIHTKEIALYFASSDAYMLAAEPCRIEHSPHTLDNCRQAIEALIRGPQGALTPILPPTTKVKGLYLLEDGELVINFSIELELEHRKLKSTSLEALMIYGIVNTLTQPALKGDQEAAVETVRLLIGDAVPREAFPAHIDVSAPIAPDPRWIAAPQA